MLPPMPDMRTVVYSTLFGYYEPLQEIAISRHSAADFLLFTDVPGLKSATWEVVHQGRLSADPARDARRLKILAHEYVADYDVSIYHDARICLKAPLAVLLAEFLPEQHCGFGCVKHPDRDCIYEEAEIIASTQMDAPEKVHRQMARYRDEGYPAHNGLIAGGFLVRRHNDPRVVTAMKAWWQEVEDGSYRDQLSFNYIAWKLNFVFNALNCDLRDNHLFDWLPPAPNRIPYGFDDAQYLALNPDVAAAGMNPRYHWSRFGYREGRRYRR
jgi:hypothetical protein